MNIELIVFYVLAGLAILSGLFVVTSQHLVRSVFMFFVTLFCVAGLYVYALADFVALTQVVIYVGGVLVLLLFAFLLSSKDALDGLEKIPSGLLSANRLAGSSIALMFLVVLVFVFKGINFEDLDWIKQAQINGNVKTVTDESVQNIGVNLMSTYLLPLEIIAILLMMALVGAAHIARKEPPEIG